MKPARGALLISGTILLASGGLVGASAQDRERTAPQIFADSCVYCHDSGGWGTRSLARRGPSVEAELLKRQNLPTALTVLAVRHGIGAMPPLTPTDVTDEELARLARWLEDNN